MCKARHNTSYCLHIKAFTLLLLLLQLNGALTILVSRMMNVWFYSPSERSGSTAHNLCGEY